MTASCSLKISSLHTLLTYSRVVTCCWSSFSKWIIHIVNGNVYLFNKLLPESRLWQYVWRRQRFLENFEQFVHFISSSETFLDDIHHQPMQASHSYERLVGWQRWYTERLTKILSLVTVFDVWKAPGFSVKSPRRIYKWIEGMDTSTWMRAWSKVMSWTLHLQMCFSFIFVTYWT